MDWEQLNDLFSIDTAMSQLLDEFALRLFTAVGIVCGVMILLFVLGLYFFRKWSKEGDQSSSS